MTRAKWWLNMPEVVVSRKTYFYVYMAKYTRICVFQIQSNRFVVSGRFRGLQSAIVIVIVRFLVGLRKSKYFGVSATRVRGAMAKSATVKKCS